MDKEEEILYKRKKANYERENKLVDTYCKILHLNEEENKAIKEREKVIEEESNRRFEEWFKICGYDDELKEYYRKLWKKI